MPSEKQLTIRLHQCLFGYEDGHRLLASSLSLPEDAASLLLVLSDLAPGLSPSDVNSYWTGVPLRSARCYALMRTWPAPEVPRPGCVWTHALLIGFADIARFSDLSPLAKYTARPTAPIGFNAYLEPLSLTPESLGPSKDENDHSVRVEDALRVIRAIYSPRANVMLHDKPGALDGAVFGLWSQQWPRLRRSFSFRTAASQWDGGAPAVRFDLRMLVQPGRDPAGVGTHSVSPPEPWEVVAIDDLQKAQPTEFRRFLWRYGSDIRRGRERFSFLAKLYIPTRTQSLAGGQLKKTLEWVSNVLPALDDGGVLKEDLVSCGQSQYSLLPPGDPLDTIEFFLQNPEVEGLPTPPAEAVEASAGLWSIHSDRVLSIAEQAAEGTSQLCTVLLRHLAGVADPATFLESTVERPHLRRRLLSANPLLLDSDYLPSIPQPELSKLLALVPGDEAIAGRLIHRLVFLDDPQVANEMLGRFTKATMRVIADQVEGTVDGDTRSVSTAWLQAIRSRPADFLHGEFVEGARSTKGLAAFAAMLGHDRPVVLKAGPLLWAAALRNARDNVQGPEGEVFLAFLLAVALASPVPGCEPLLERAFEPVHTGLWKSTFSRDAYAILTRHLPQLHWWEYWDTCRRLRIAVVRAYVETDLDPQSFRRLTADSDLFNRLVDLAADSNRGQRFLDRVADRLRTLEGA